MSFALVAWPARADGAAGLPSGFVQAVYVDGLHDPNAMEFAPDGRLFIAERITGRLRVVKKGELLAEPFVTVSVPREVPGRREEAARPGFARQGIYHYGTYRSSGLRGVAFDPEFERNGHIYLYYMNDSPRVNRVSRFTARGANPDRAERGSEKVLLDIPMHAQETDGPVADGGSHNGGALFFGPDGKLYITVGDGWNPAPQQAPQDPSNLIGKVLRINRDGSVPEDNPFRQLPGARPEIWALGFRNPYTAAVRPRTDAIYINDVVWGKQTVYELVRGGNYQHPSYKGTGKPQKPVHAGTGLIAGGAWYFGSQFPESFRGSYFLSDWRAGVIRRMLSAEDRTVVDFATGLQYPTYIKQGPDGALYWLSANYETLEGAVYRIEYHPEKAKSAPGPRVTARRFRLEEGLLGHWPLDDGSGDVARDLSTRGRHGALAGGAGWPAAREEGRSLEFGKGGGRVKLGPMEIESPQLTIAAWIRPDSFLDGMADNRIISKARGIDEQDHFWMVSSVRNQVPRLRFRLKAGGRTSTLVAGSGELKRGVWTHVSATYDGRHMRLFQDGREVGSLSKTGAPDRGPGTPVWLGDNPPDVGSRPFHGRLRDVRMYNRALGEAELVSLIERTQPTRASASAGRTAEVLRAFEAALALDGDMMRGRAVFQERCANCHRLEEMGQEFGPDLTTAAAAGDKRQLLEAILDPNLEVAPEYWSYVVEGRGGEFINGLMVAETPERLTIRTVDGQSHELRRQEIKWLRREESSIMPERLEAELTPQQMADLLAYVLAFRR